MTRLWLTGEPISVEVDRHLEPISMVWRERNFPIHQVHQRWEVDQAVWKGRGPLWRCYYTITTNSGLLCVIYYDQLRELWFLSKVYD